MGGSQPPSIFSEGNLPMVSSVLAQPASCPDERFVTEVYSELSAETIQKRSAHVNVLLRLSMLAGLPMQFEAALILLCDLAAEMVAYDKALVFWDEGQQHMQLRTWRGFAARPATTVSGTGTDVNLLNLWAVRYGRPLLVARGEHAPVDTLLECAGAASVLTLPLFVSNRVRGSLQLFSASPRGFALEDAQLLW